MTGEKVRNKLVEVTTRIETVAGRRVSHDHFGSIMAQSVVDLVEICAEQQKHIIDLEKRLRETERIIRM